jgi:beta-glucosidase
MDDPAGVQVALDTARAGIVLLKNDGGVLPLDPKAVRRIAVIGPGGHPANWGGGGSSHTDPFRAVSIFDGLRQVPGLAVTYSRGELDLNALVKSSPYDGPIQVQAFGNPDLKGEPAGKGTIDRIALHPDRAPFPGMPKEHFSVRWTAHIHSDKGGPHLFATSSDDGIRVYLDDKLVIDDWNEHAEHMDTATVPLMAGAHYTVRVEYFQAGGDSEARFGWGPAVDARRDAVEAARHADVAVVCAGFTMHLEGEGWDRTYELPSGQPELIRAVAAANPRTIVVLSGGGGVDWTGWLDKVPAVVHAWYPGQEGGRAVADILYGVVNPAGRLPASFERLPKDNPSAPYYMKESDAKAGRAVYGEGLFTGYRGYDRAGVEPQFCFGHGLSYTTFEYTDLTTTPAAGKEPVEVTLKVRNTGTRAGTETVQVYVAQRHADVPRPPKELKGFTKVALKAGESRQVTVTLPPDAFAYWHPARKQWVVDPGWFDILVGASVRDIRLRGAVARAN